MSEHQHIVFFDGVCGLCNGLVDFLLKIDKKHVLKFAPLQGETARNLLPAHFVQDVNSIVFIKNGQTLEKSKAVFAIFDSVGGAWKPLSFLKFYPPIFSDKVYDLVASTRYKLFGKRESCRFPTEEEKKYFLD